MTLQHALLTARALYELAWHDITNARSGFRAVSGRLVSGCPTSGRRRLDSPQPVLDAVNLAVCLYCKPVQCLQRTVATVRLLRKYGIPCSLTIGYRPSPFFMHAWVEIEGQISNDLRGYQERLLVLQKL